jgi:hypothetical protein
MRDSSLSSNLSPLSSLLSPLYSAYRDVA